MESLCILPDNIKILRFLDKDGLLRTLGNPHEKNLAWGDLRPTFLLRSLEHYRSLEDHRADPNENIITTVINGVRCNNTNGNPVLVSCWSLYKEEELHAELPWIKERKYVAAIQSTVGEVTKIMNAIVPNKREEFHKNGQINAFLNMHR